MTNLDPLILDFLEWLSAEPRRYSDVMDAWRTSCPRLTVWEDTIDRGLATRISAKGKGTLIVVTEEGCQFLRQHRPSVATQETVGPEPLLLAQGASYVESAAAVLE